MATSKEPIKLRRRETSNGRQSLYLDIYSNGYRRYEYLRLYLIPEKSRADKEKNRQTEALAEAIRAKRVVELRNQEYGFRDECKSEVRFFDYYRAMVEKRRGEHTRSNWGNWLSALNYLLSKYP